MAIELFSLGLNFFINRWTEKKNEIQKNIKEYLEAAAKDGIIKNVDAVAVKEKIFSIIKVNGQISKIVKKGKNISQINGLIKEFRIYISLLKEITDRLPYDHLNVLLNLQGSVNDVSFGEIEITSLESEVAILMIYISNIILKNYCMENLLDEDLTKQNYKNTTVGLKLILFGKKVLNSVKEDNEKLYEFIDTYCLIFQAIAQYFYTKLTLQDMVGAKKDILNNSIINFRNAIHICEGILDLEKKGRELNEYYIQNMKIISDHSKALLTILESVRVMIKGLNSSKNLANLANECYNNNSWVYNEWKFLSNILRIYFNVKEFPESEIDYTIGEEINLELLDPDAPITLDKEILSIEAGNFVNI
jgi:hypothetical protein